MRETPLYLFPASAYPFVIEALHPDTGAVVWRRKVDQPLPLEKVYIPPLKKRLSHAVKMRITFATGEILS